MDRKIPRPGQQQKKMNRQAVRSFYFCAGYAVYLHIILNTSLARSEHHSDLHLGQAPDPTMGHRQEQTEKDEL